MRRETYFVECVGKDGKWISREEGLRESIRSILTTPKGSRVIEVEYGCSLFDYLDSSKGIGAIYSDVVTSLERWIPDLQVNSIDISANDKGVITIDLYATHAGEEKKVEVTL